MAAHGKRNWIVTVTSDESSPKTCGPYTERRAKELADQFNARIEVDDFAEIRATAYEIHPVRVTQMLAEFGQ